MRGIFSYLFPAECRQAQTSRIRVAPIRFLVVATALAGSFLAPPAAKATVGVCETGSPIEVESSVGTPLFGYATLEEAFTQINSYDAACGRVRANVHCTVGQYTLQAPDPCSGRAFAAGCQDYAAGPPYPLPWHSGEITIEICGDTTESVEPTLWGSGDSQSYTNNRSSYASVTIIAAGGAARRISGAIANLLVLNGADNVTIDGLNTGGNSLTLESTAASTFLSTIKLTNNAHYNTLRNLTIRGGGGTTGGWGVIYYPNSGGGASNNTIENNLIGASGTNRPAAGINFQTSIASTNSVRNNAICDYINYGVWLHGAESGWTITGNSFFQTAPRTLPDFNGNAAIYINNVPLAGGYTLSSNIIGGSAPDGSGTSSFTGNRGSFNGIYLSAANSPVSHIDGNTITGVSLAASPHGGWAWFAGIYVERGVADIGTLAGNTIGAASGTGALSPTSAQTGSTASPIYGIYEATGGTVTIANNSIGSINTGGGALIPYSLYGIYAGGTGGNFTIINNTIGSVDTPHSITVGTSGVTTASTGFTGIFSSATGPLNVSNNTIQNCSSFGRAYASFAGVTDQGATGTVVIANNSILNGTYNGQNIANNNFFAPIYSAGAAATKSITDNVIKGHTITSTDGEVRGIWQHGGVSGAINIDRNHLGDESAGFVTYTSLSPVTTQLLGIYNDSGSATTALSIQGNNIQGVSYASPASGTAQHYYLYNYWTTRSQNISGNTFTNLDVNTAGNVTFIFNNALLPAGGSSTVSNNAIVTAYRKSAAGGTVTLYGTPNTGSGSAPGTTKLIENNDFSHITLVGATTMAGWADLEGRSDGPQKNIVGNRFTDWTTGAAPITVIQNNSAGPNSAVANNTIANINGQSTINGIYMYNNNGGATQSVSGNSISSLTSSGAGGAVNAIYSATGQWLSNLDISNNTISTLSTPSTSTGVAIASPAGPLVNAFGNAITHLVSTGTSTGIAINGGTATNAYDNSISDLTSTATSVGVSVTAGVTVNVFRNVINGLASPSTSRGLTISGITTLNAFKNKIYDVSASGSAGTANGILVSNGTTINTYDNVVGDIRTPAATGVTPTNSAIGLNVAGGTTVNAYFNTVRIDGTSIGANWGSSAVYVNTASNVTLRNNVFVNVSTRTGTGRAVAYRRSGNSLPSYQPASNNNDFFGSTIFTDGTNTDTTFATYKDRVGPIVFPLAPRDTESISENPPFASITGSDATFLHIAPTAPTALEEGGRAIAGIADDIDADVRNATTPDIGADEFLKRADVSVSKADIQDPVGYGQTITYTITVTNAGPHKAYAIGLADTIPANTTFVSLTASADWSCTAPLVGGTGSVSCTRASLSVGDSASVTLAVRVSECAMDGTAIGSTTTVSAATTDPNPDNNTANQMTTTNGTPITCTSDGNPCTLDVCLTGLCQHPAAPEFTACGDPDATACNAADSCDGAGNCVDRKKPANAVCLAGSGACDPDDICDGSTNACAARLAAEGTSCGDATDSECTDPDTCDASGNCLANNASNGTLCGDAGTQCTNQDTCLGGACHDNGFQSAGSACGDPASGACDGADTCDGAGTCGVNHIADGTSCGDAGTQCTNQNTCLAGACHDNGFQPAGTACGDQTSGACDTADSCDGSGGCQANHVSDGTSCGDAGTQCTNQDTCLAGACHDNGYQTAGTACGDPGSGACDAADTCDGAGACQVNHVADGTSCGDAGTQCTNQDTCLGGACHDNGYQPAGTACGDQTSGACDTADTCDGSGACQANHVADGTSCGDAGTQCTNQDTCLGGACHDNGFQTAGTACGDPASGACDAADSCDGSGGCQANHVADGMSCGDAGTQCTNQDTCLGGACHDNGYQTAGTACGDPGSGACDAADTCDGAGACQVNHVADGTSCGDAGTQCTNQDTCLGGACHDNGYQPAGTACGDQTSGACDTADTCDGSGACQANHVADGTSCGDAGTQCTNQDTCLGGACHDNGFQNAGTACGDPASGACDGADTCDGAGACNVNHIADGTSCGDAGTQCTNQYTCLAGACHDNGFQPAGTACGDQTSGACDTADTCDGSGGCQANHVSDGTSCGDAGTQCTNQDTCLSGACHDNGYQTAGTACGDPASGACDAADSCDGSGGCQANHVADGMSCGDAGTQCTNQDTCLGGACHDNGYQTAGTACGDPGSGACDAADTCDGAGACQVNHVADGTSCGDTGTQCTNQDTCLAGACHDNGYQPAGTACGDQTSSACDTADTCDGAGTCSGNHVADGTSCGDAGTQCTNQDTCLGGACHDNGYQNAGTACGDPASGACDGANTCDGTGTCQTNHVADGTSCGDAGTQCTNQDTCLAGACHDNGYQPAGTACGSASTGQCDNADTCDGTGTCQANHVADGTSCGDAGTQCTNQDTCLAGACHDNGYQPAGTACGDPASGACDGADTCDGAGACQINHVGDGTACTSDGNDCTSDVCGAGVCTHPNRPAGTACGSASDTDCDNPDTCNAAGNCQANNELNGTACTSDGNNCTSDVCGAGVCTHPGSPAGSETCNNLDDDCDGIVDDSLSTLTVSAIRHNVGPGAKPVVRKEPLAGLLVSIYDRSAGSCVMSLCGGSNFQSYDCIFQLCSPVVTGATINPARTVTNAAGQATFSLPPGSYLVLGGAGTDKHLGQTTSLACGATRTENLQQIVNSRNEAIPATQTVRTGSLLYIIEPQEIVWNEPQELYPFIFVAEGDWLETASVTPPEGFVSDFSALTALVADQTTEAVQFTLTDVGSDWVPTITRHELMHNYRREIVLGEVGVELEPTFALTKGLDQWGRKIGPSGLPDPITPIPSPAARLEGWIESGRLDPLWTFKVEVLRETSLTLVIETLGGTPLMSVAADLSDSPGHYAFTWDPLSMTENVTIDELQVRISAGQLDKVYRLRPAVQPPGTHMSPEVSADGVGR